MAAVLVTIQQAKDHLQKPTMPPGDPDEPDLILKLAQAETTILNFIGDHADPSWSSPATTPGEVSSAILIWLARLDSGRGDDESAKNDEEAWLTITRLLRRYRVEAIA